MARCPLKDLAGHYKELHDIARHSPAGQPGLQNLEKMENAEKQMKKQGKVIQRMEKEGKPYVLQHFPSPVSLFLVFSFVFTHFPFFPNSGGLAGDEQPHLHGQLASQASRTWKKWKMQKNK